MENILLSNLEFERDVIIYTDVKTEMVEPMQVSLLLTIEFVICQQMITDNFNLIAHHCRC